MATPTSVIKCLVDQFCCPLQSAVFLTLLVQPNINPITQARHVGITHSELVLVTSKMKSTLLWLTWSVWLWLWPRPEPLMSRSMHLTYLAKGDDFQFFEHIMLFPLLEMPCPCLACT